MAAFVILLLLAPLLVINLFFVAEVALGLPGGGRKQWAKPSGRTVIILPAHDEEAVIGRTLGALTAAARTDFDVLVVADNCSDRTAAIARGQNVQVAERMDPERRGKGFALAFARDWLRADPPAAVIVLDSDCRTDRESLLALAGSCQQLGVPAQAINLLEPSRTAGPLVQVSSFAFLIKNLVRQRGLQRLAGGVHLTGTGMCLPWPLFDSADLATASIVEDIRLGIELAALGKHPRLVSECVVWSPHAAQAQTLGQRSRWEGGFLSLARVAAPDLLKRGLAKGSLPTIFAGLDLLVPPLALLAMVNAAVLLILVVLAVIGATSWLPTFVLGAVGLLVAAAILLAWWREGRDFLSTAALIRLPLYPLWKIPMYLKLARTGAPKNWQRTERD